jgi:hypothetical protein
MVTIMTCELEVLVQICKNKKDRDYEKRKY